MKRDTIQKPSDIHNNNRKLIPGESALLSEAFHTYYRDLYLYINSRVKNTTITDDIIAETFFLACDKIDDFKVSQNQKGWLIRVAHFKILEMYNRLKSRDLPYSEDIEESFEADLSQYAVMEMLQSIKEDLNPEEHKRFIRYFLWGCSLAEMAKLENITEANMSTRLSRLRSKLRKYL